MKRSFFIKTALKLVVNPIRVVKTTKYREIDNLSLSEKVLHANYLTTKSITDMYVDSLRDQLATQSTR